MRLLPAAMAAALMLVPQVPNGTNLPVFGYQVVRAYPHDPTAFTQGLQYVDGIFYEGTGLNGRSSIRKVKLETGEVLEKRDVPAQYFGEGITVWKSDYIARIAPDGHVIGWIDLSGLLSPSERGTVEASGGVLNGIAYDEAKDRLFVTGKLWPKLFEIKIVPKR